MAYACTHNIRPYLTDFHSDIHHLQARKIAQITTIKPKKEAYANNEKIIIINAKLKKILTFMQNISIEREKKKEKT